MSQFVWGIGSTPYSQRWSDCADIGDGQRLGCRHEIAGVCDCGHRLEVQREEDIVLEDVVGLSLDFHRWPDGHDLREAARAV